MGNNLSIGKNQLAYQSTKQLKNKQSNILVVDHDFIVIEKLHAVISSLGSLCQFATSAEKAIQLCATLSIDLIIINLSLKDKSGLKVIKSAKLPFIILAKQLDSSLIDVCICSGELLGVLTKPLTDEILIEATIKTALVNARQRYQLQKDLYHGVKTTYYVNTAKGILMERFRINDKAALKMLHDENKRCSKKIVTIAKELVDHVNKTHRQKDWLFERYSRFLSKNL